MKPVVTANEMRESEKKLFDTGVSSFSVMERAAMRLTEEIADILKSTEKTAIFACGSGGNGGDGYAAARLFTKKGGRAIVIQVYDAKNDDAVRMKKLAEDAVFAVVRMDALNSLPTPDAWVDCVFGIGLTRDVDDRVSCLIDRMHEDKEKGAVLISCDVPTGLNSDTGEIMGKCAEADYTVTFEWLKRGHLLGMGPDVSGEIRVKPIGVDEKYLSGDRAQLIEKEDVKKILPQRKKTAHKNDFGHLLVVAGSFGMAGAGAMCAKAALRSGAGLVTIACIERLVPIYQTLVPEAMCIALKEEGGVISDDSVGTLENALKGKTAVVFGPGIGKSASKNVLEMLLKSGLPMVIDADGLNILSENRDLYKLLKPNHALTPHPGEAKRLIGSVSKDAVKDALALSALGASAILKGATTVCVREGKILLSASGNNGMAKGGSGDVLSGMVGAMMAGGMDAENALWASSEIHGIAGDIARDKKGAIAMLPTDLIECIGEAYEYVINA